MDPSSAPVTRVLLVDDHPLFRLGLRAVLEEFSEFEVAGEAGDAQEACAAVESAKPDVAVLDVRLGSNDGIALTRKLKRHHPQLKIVMLSAVTDADYVAEALRAGALGYIVKEGSLDDCVTGLRSVASGERFIAPRLSEAALSLYHRITAAKDEGRTRIFDVLSGREREIFRMLVQGGTSRSIANQLSITLKTVDCHRQHILEKLSCHSIGDLIRFATRHALEVW